MSLTITEANDVNTLLRFVLGIDRPLAGPVSSDAAREAAQHLAGSANKKLMAGLRAGDVDEQWTNPADKERARVRKLTEIADYATWLMRSGEQKEAGVGARLVNMVEGLSVLCSRCHGSGRAADLDGKDCGICIGAGEVAPS